MKNDYKKLSYMLYMRRQQKGLSQRQLANVVGISNAELSKIESGIRQSPNLINLIKLCEVLNINPIKLLILTNFIDKKYLKEFTENNLKKFKVLVNKTATKELEIDAKNGDEAIDLVSDFLLENDISMINPEEKYDFEAVEINNEKLDFISDSEDYETII